MGRLAGQIALITGAASGIGRAIALTYASEGAIVAIVDKNGDRAKEVRGLIEQAGGTARDFEIDVTDYDNVVMARDKVVSEFGALDILVNNAAIGYDGHFLNSTLEEWRHVITVDLEAVYMGSKLAAEVMALRNYGRIITITSIQAMLTTGCTSAYNAAKAGLLGLTRAMAMELAPYNIIVNGIAPGFIRTDMSILPDGTDETDTSDFHEYYLKRRRIPLARVGQAQDVAGTALFLASDDCRYMTGQILNVDGGLSITI